MGGGGTCELAVELEVIGAADEFGVDCVEICSVCDTVYYGAQREHSGQDGHCSQRSGINRRDAAGILLLSIDGGSSV